MAEGKKETGLSKSKASSDKPASKPAPKKPKPASYVIAKGKSISSKGRIFVPGDPITADEVADLEALVKGGFVVKA